MPKPKLFTPEMFTPTQWDTAEDKEEEPQPLPTASANDSQVPRRARAAEG